MRNREDYAEKVYAATEFIESRLTQPIELEDVSRHVSVSKFYFSRIFQAAIGETVFDYIRKRRLHEIARQLVATSKPIVELALEYQYDSQQSMSKAFSRHYGISPGRYRKNGVDRFFLERTRITRRDIRVLAEDLVLPMTTVELPALRIVGLRQHMPITEPGPVEAARGEFRQRAPNLEPHRRHRGFFEVTIMSAEEMSTFTENAWFDGLIGFSLKSDAPALAGRARVTPAAGELTELAVPAGRYLSFHYTGNNAIGTLSKLYRHIFSTGLLRRRESLAEGSFFHYYPSGQAPGRRERTSIRFFLPLAEDT